jgi:hypothetical protein
MAKGGSDLLCSEANTEKIENIGYLFSSACVLLYETQNDVLKIFF